MSGARGKIIKILFVCHGNICRSPMAEFVMKDLAEKAGIGDKVYIASAATSSEEIGSPVHRGTVRELEKRGISCAGKYAVRLEKSDYGYYDYIVGMDIYNLRNMLRLFGGDPENKVRLLMSRFRNDLPGYSRRVRGSCGDRRAQIARLNFLRAVCALLTLTSIKKV